MKPIVVALLLAPVVILGAAKRPAHAEPTRAVMAGLPPFEIVTILRSVGFEPLARPVRGAGVFYVRALDPGDMDVRLTVDARTGRILAVRSMTGVGPIYGPSVAGSYPAVYRRPFDGAAGFEDATGALPVPPRAVPRAPAGPGHPTALPLPRPRPSQAIAAAVSPPPNASSPNPAEAATPKPAEAAPATPGKVELPPVTPLE